MTSRPDRILKVFLVGLKRILPSAWFEAFCDFAFPKYKALVRLLYLVRGFFMYRLFDKERWCMVRKIHSIMPYSLVGVGGLEATYRAARELNRRGVAGDFVELGVARGGSAALLGRVIFDEDEPDHVERKLWLFDSFEGLPDPTQDDFDRSRGNTTGSHIRPLPKGACLGTLEEVRQLMFGVRKFPREKIEFVQGWFQDTVPGGRDRIGKIALLRIDSDWYESTKTCLEGLYDKVTPAGIIIVDDYESCYGCEKAVNEFLANSGIEVDMQFDGRGGCYFAKPHEATPLKGPTKPGPIASSNLCL